MLGAFVEVLDLSAAAFAGIIVIMVTIELGGGSAAGVFAATGILSLLLLPARMPAIFYILFGGWYPIVKERIERLRWRPLRWIIKLAALNAALAVAFVVAKYVLMLPDAVSDWTPLLFVAMNGVFILFDYALTQLITVYLLRLRGRLGIDKFFK